MQVLIDKSFDKDSDKIHDKQLLRKIQEAIHNIQDANQIADIKNIKKMTGYDTFFRIRIGDYRIGFEIIDNKAILLRFKHRKDIYKVFPPH